MFKEYEARVRLGESVFLAVIVATNALFARERAIELYRADTGFVLRELPQIEVPF